MNGDSIFKVIIVVIVVVSLISVFFTFIPLGLWVSSLAANVKVSIFNLIGMRLRRLYLLK